MENNMTRQNPTGGRYTESQATDGNTTRYQGRGNGRQRGHNGRRHLENQGGFVQTDENSELSQRVMNSLIQTTNRNNKNELNKCLKILNLIVCGLVSKLQCPECLEELCKYDIIILTETKTDNADNIEITGYTVFIKNRNELTRRKSGGIAVYVKT